VEHRLVRTGRQVVTWLKPARRRIGVGLAFVFLLLLLLWQRCGLAGCPNVQQLTSYQPGGASVLYDIAGEPFADLAPIDHVVVSIDSLPAYVPAAFVAIEDKRFYRHNGVDYRRVVGAAIADIKARGFVQGFSTITMQLARNVWPDRLPGQQRTLKRKILEIRVARQIEREFEKREILELYLNHIYFGNGAYGIENAARTYFGKSARDLTLAQAATLAALPKSHVIYDPRRRPERARERRDLVLAQMLEQGHITAEQAERAKQTRLSVRRDPPKRREEPQIAPYYAEAVRRVLEDRFGEEVYTAPLKVYTTLDRNVQRIAEQELERQLRAAERGGFGRFEGDRYVPGDPPGEQTDYLQGAVVVLDPRTGAVRALVGGRDYRQSRFDRATRALRQAGSAFKPFVYAAALQEGYVASQQIKDAPLEAGEVRLSGGEVWDPREIGGQSEGFVSLRDALVRSKNLPTIRLAVDVGLDEVIATAAASGIRTPIPEVPSIAIGAAGVTPLQLAAAYTPFANEGNAVEPRFIVRIEDANGRLVWEPKPRIRRVLRPEVAYMVTDMLGDAVTRGTGAQAMRMGYRGPAAGKTGTTNDGSDVWFVGYTPDLVTAIWVGFDQPKPIVEDATGGRIVAPVWGRMMGRIYRDRGAPVSWVRPAGVVERRVDPPTGLLLHEGCRPRRGAPTTELFIEGTEPPATCPRGTPTNVRESVFVRAWNGISGTVRRFGRWVGGIFDGDEEKPVRRDRYLGAPPLPRAETLRAPTFDPRVLEPPPLEDSILPRVPDISAETTAVADSLLGVPVPADTLSRDSTLLRDSTLMRDSMFTRDSLVPLLPRVDTLRRDTTVRSDTMPNRR